MTIRRRSNKRKKSQRGGEVAIKFNQPEVSQTSAASAIKGSIQAQKENNSELMDMKKQMSGGSKDVVIPQMDQAGESGNKSILDGISNLLKGAADSEFDNDIELDTSANSDYTGGRRRTRRKRRKRKSRKRKSRKRKSRKRKSRKRKSRKRKSRKRKSRKRKSRRRRGGDTKLTSADVRKFNIRRNIQSTKPRNVISPAMAENIKRREHKKQAKELGVADFVTIG
jgi:hypothetical protein